MPRLVEQKVTVVAEIGVTAEFRHEQGGIKACGDLGDKEHQLLTRPHGGLEKAEGAVKHLSRLSCKSPAFFCLGGKAIPYPLSADEEKHVKKIIDVCRTIGDSPQWYSGFYYGIDFVFNEGKIVFNELEDTVGARMVYETTDMDIIKMFCDEIRQTLKI